MVTPNGWESLIKNLKDIIKIDKKVDQELDVYVGNIKKFNALPGYFEDKYAVRITDVIREESE